MDVIERLEKEIGALKERNRRVEAEKAWETSSFRTSSIAAVTYVVAATVLYSIGVANFLLAALVPTAGYLLSTLSLPAVRTWWMRRNIEDR